MTAPKSPANPAPPRPSASLRRTTSIDVDWPEGRSAPMRLQARARDVFTKAEGGAPILLAEAAFEARLAADRTILAITADPPNDSLSHLVGERGGGHLRDVLDEKLPQDRQNGTPLQLILDDISGVSLVAGWAWSQWSEDWAEEMRRYKANPDFGKKFSRVNVCVGLAEGSSGLGIMTDGAPTPDLQHPDDPEGWHAMPSHQAAAMRRARRIDITRAGNVLLIDSAFQDSATAPQGPRMALHEYRLTASADPQTFILQSLAAEPRVLPFPECPTAAANMPRLLGTSMQNLRKTVLAELRGTAGCTHLNDALRALNDVPSLARYLP